MRACRSPACRSGRGATPTRQTRTLRRRRPSISPARRRRWPCRAAAGASPRSPAPRRSPRRRRQRPAVAARRARPKSKPRSRPPRSRTPPPRRTTRGLSTSCSGRFERRPGDGRSSAGIGANAELPPRPFRRRPRRLPERLDEGGELLFVDVADRDIASSSRPTSGRCESRRWSRSRRRRRAPAVESRGSSVTAIRCLRLR